MKVIIKFVFLTVGIVGPIAFSALLMYASYAEKEAIKEYRLQFSNQGSIKELQLRYEKQHEELKVYISQTYPNAAFQ